MAENFTPYAKKKWPNCCLKTQQELQKYMSTDGNCCLKDICKTKHPFISWICRETGKWRRELKIDWGKHVLASFKYNNVLEVAHPQSGSSSIRFVVELEFRNVPREKLLGAKERPNNKLNPLIWHWTRATLVGGERLCATLCNLNYFKRIIKQALDSAVVWPEELCRSRRVLSASADNSHRGLHNSSGHTKAEPSNC